MRSGRIPNPLRYNSVKEWAEAFYEFASNTGRIDDENNPLPVLLPHKTNDQLLRASTDGIIVYDPTIDKPVVSINGVWVPILMNNDIRITSFGEQIIVERTPLIELKSINGLSVIRDVTEVTNSGTVAPTASKSEFAVSTGTTANSSAILESAERGRYVPGFSAEFGMGVRIPTLPTGDQVARWGGTNDEFGSGTESGLAWGVDATGVFTSYTDNGTETKVYQSNWNKDTMDGSGDANNPSGELLTLSRGNIHKIEFTWYGYGDINYYVSQSTGDGRQRDILVNSVRIEDATSIEDPNLYIFNQVTNGSTASDFIQYVSGRSYTILGRYEPSRRSSSQAREGVATNTTRKPLTSFRRKSDKMSISVRALDFEGEVSGADCYIQVVLNATLTGTSWQDLDYHNNDECAVETDITATGMSGGHVLYQQRFSEGTANKALAASATLTLENIEVPRQQPVTLAVVTPSGSGTVSMNFKVQEEW